MFQPKNTQMEPESDSDWDSLPGDVQQPSSSPEGSPRHQPPPPAGSPRDQINHKRPRGKQQATLPSQQKTSITNSPANQPRTKPDVLSSQMPSQLYGKAGVTNFVDRSGGINTTFIDRGGLDGRKNKDLQPPDENENKVHQGSQQRGDIGIDIELNEMDYHQRNPPYTDFKAALPEQDSTRLGLQNDKPNKGKVKTSYVMTKDAQLEDHSWDSDSDALQDHVSHSRQHLTPRDKKSSKNYGHLEENNIAKEGISENQEGKLELRTFGVPQDIENQVTGYSYHFDHGSNYQFKVNREWKEAQMKKIADRSEKWLRYMWQEAFSSLRIVTDFVFIFVLELLRFVLHYIALRFLGGVITVTGDHFLKPFLALLFNSIIQPTFIFTRNVFAGVKNLLQPLLEISNTSIAQAASFLRAFRLFELNWKPVYERGQKHEVHVL